MIVTAIPGTEIPSIAGTGFEELVFLSASDEDVVNGHWHLVKPEDVPYSMRDPSVIGQLRANSEACAEAPEDGRHYRVLPAPPEAA